jgi:hypothetical protein
MGALGPLRSAAYLAVKRSESVHFASRDDLRVPPSLDGVLSRLAGRDLPGFSFGAAAGGGRSRPRRR